MNFQPSTLFIFGPTAVGKSALAEQIASTTPAAIVNMDIGQCYVPLSIGTAKPNLETLQAEHHLFNILDAPRSLTVVEYAALLKKTIGEIHARGHHALVVGGSAFYLTSLFFPPVSSVSCDAPLDLYDVQDLWNRLHAIDPERAEAINPTDTYRLKRALSIWYSTGRKPSEYHPIFAPIVPSWRIVCVVRDRDDLYRRIDERVKEMMQIGWLDEVAALSGTPWEPFLREKNFIGYPELLDYVAGKTSHSLEHIINEIQQKTRNYAKRQMTFWRRLKRLLYREHCAQMIEELNLTHIDTGLYIKHQVPPLSGGDKNTLGDS